MSRMIRMSGRFLIVVYFVFVFTAAREQNSCYDDQIFEGMVGKKSHIVKISLISP